MPRAGIRRKADTPIAHNDMAELLFEPKRHKPTRFFQLPMPERPRVEGRAFVCGQGDMGQLGLGIDSKVERSRPTLLESIKNVVDVCAGGMHSLVLTAEGYVYSFGCNDEGALGRDTSVEDSEYAPEMIELPDKVVKISAGDSHSACLLVDGRVFAWGSFRDSRGNMGLTLEGNKRLPIDVLPDYLSCDIASGADHLVILTNGGKVFTVGCAEQGQLGRVSHRSASGESRRGKTELLRPAEVMNRRAKYIDAIWATNYCTFLREKAVANIWAFGLNNYKQLAYDQKNYTVITNPITTKLEDVKQIAGGQHHTMLLKTDGSCHVIGRRDYGRLGLGELEDDVIELMPVTALANEHIVSIACGETQSFAITEGGKLYAWGMGSNNQLGTGSEEDVLVPQLIVSKQIQDKRIIAVSSGGQHSIFLVESDQQEDKQNIAIVEPAVQGSSTDGANTEKFKESKAVPDMPKGSKPLDKVKESEAAPDMPKESKPLDKAKESKAAPDIPKESKPVDKTKESKASPDMPMESKPLDKPKESKAADKQQKKADKQLKAADKQSKETKAVEKAEKASKAGTQSNQSPKTVTKVEKKCVVKVGKSKAAEKAEKSSKAAEKAEKSRKANEKSKQPGNTNGDIDKDDTPSSTTNDDPPQPTGSGNEAVPVKRSRGKM